MAEAEHANLQKRIVFTPNRGPLTTVFTPPVDCLATTTQWGTGFFVGSDSSAGGFQSCYPSSTISVAPGDDAFDALVYSPGVCPVGYTYLFPCEFSPPCACLMLMC